MTWMGMRMRHLTKNPSLKQWAAPALLAVLSVVALAGCVGTAPVRVGVPAASRSFAFEPHLSHIESTYIEAAWHTTAARDQACRGFHGPELTNGSPSLALNSMFAILRRPTTPADGLRSVLRWSPGAQLYVNQIRPARLAFGASFYVIPAGNVSGQRGVPARCEREQVVALKRQLSHAPRRERVRILAAQSRYLAYLRFLALHAQGICAGYRAATPAGSHGLQCATVADFDRWGVLVDASVYIDHAAVFWTVVPDGVATVTLRFVPDGGPLTHTITTTVRPVNNVVVAKEPYKAPDQSGFPSTIVLRAADGRTIKQIAVTPNMPTLCGYGC